MPRTPKRVKQKYRSLREWRDAVGLSQTEAATLVPMAQSGWWKLEVLKTAPRPALARRLVELTGVPMESLLAEYFSGRSRYDPKPSKRRTKESLRAAS